MTNEIGNTLLNSVTKGSFDAGNMAKMLAEAEISGSRAIIDKNTKSLEKEVSGLTYLRANLEAFNTYAKDLASPTLFNQYSATAADPSVLSVSVSGKTAPGNYTVQSLALAQAQTVVANTGYASRTSAIPEGDIELNIGGQLKTITVGPSNNTLEGLQQTINDGDYGINASIIRDGSEYKLMFSAKETGADSAFSFAGTGALAGFKYDPNDLPGSSFSETSAAQDAQMSVNGLVVSSSTNTFDDVIEGVSIQLNSVGAAQTLTTARDSESAINAVKDFVEVYNQLGTILKDLGSYEKLTEEQKEDPANEYKGDLAGSSLLREIRGQVRDAMLGSLDVGGAYNTLGSIGVTLDRNGVMQLDEAKLSTVANSDMDAIARLFSKSGSSADSMINVIGGSEKTQMGNYELIVDSLATRAQVTGAAATLDVNNDIVIGAGAEFKIKLDNSDEAVISIAAGNYATADFAAIMENAINNSTAVKASGARMSVAFDASNQLVMTSDRFGSGSKIEMSGFVGLDNAGLSGDLTPATQASAQGENVQGKLVMSDGSQLDIGAYADLDDGRRIKISDFAVVGTEPAEARGLQFEVLGGATGSRGTIDFLQGFGSRIYETINNALDKEKGTIGLRETSISERMDRLEQQREKVDTRYEKLELKYRLQFSIMQSVMASMESTRSFLDATYNQNKG
ncbi:MAG: flagellar filament capping protein FliD [Thiomicrospira sp.]